MIQSARTTTLTATFLALALTLAGCSSGSKKTDAKASAPAAAAASKPADKVADKKADKKAAKAAKSAEKMAAKPADKKVEAAAGASKGSTVTCTSGSVTRELTVVSKDGGCAVNYTKDGNTNEIATGSASSAHCKEVQEKVKGNLEKAGYACKQCFLKFEIRRRPSEKMAFIFS